jgi:hypothetical protein
VLQLFALGKASGQGLDEVVKAVSQARLDDWTVRLRPQR